MATTLGLDLGIASIGWCLFDDDKDGYPQKIIDIGSYVFNQIENPKSGQTENIVRRQKRLMRRQRRRKVRRLAEGRQLFKDTFGLDFFDVVAKRNTKVTPFEIKVKGLTQKLTPEELMIALYHYLKYRGYRSNRKVDDDKNTEDKVLLNGIGSLKKEILSRNQAGEAITVSGVLLEKWRAEPIDTHRLHNSGTDYHLTVSRSMYLDEMNALLDRQISFKVIDAAFKEKFIALFSRQRDFSDGPSQPSNYHVSLDRLIGKCAYDGQQRSCKDSYSARRFVLLSALNNLMYKPTADDKKYCHLSSDNIRSLETFCLDKKSVTFEALFKKLGFMPFKVKGLTLTRKQYKTVYAKFCSENKIEFGKPLDPKYNDKLSDAIYKATLNATFFKNSEIVYSLRKKLLAEPNLSEQDKILVENPDFYDEIADILLKTKTDTKIREACAEKHYPSWIVENIVTVENVAKTIDLSTSLCRKLCPYLEQGLTYDKAMERLGYQFSAISHASSIDKMPDIDTALKETKQTLTNPVVKHTLVKLRNLLNAVIDIYGKPDHFAIELNRDLKRNFADRKEIQRTQQENQVNNIRLKTEIVEKFPEHFKTIFDLNHNNDALLRYRLYKQQGGYSPYTNKPIQADDIFDGDLYQIDHILPYSRSFDDSFNNKVLVEAKENQNKGNQMPLEYFHDASPMKAYLSSHYLPREKVSRLLATSIDDDFLKKDFEDGSYIATLAKDLITYFLLPEGETCHTIAGGMTEKLRTLWGLGGKTHSYLSSSDYHYSAKFRNDYEYQSFKIEEGTTPSITFEFSFRKNGSFLSTLKKATASGKRPLTEDQTDLNRSIDDFIAQKDYFYQRFNLTKDKTIRGLQDSINYVSVNDASSARKDAGLYILGSVTNDIDDDITKKNRSNDLHHAVDAAVIGCISHALTQKVTKFYENNERAINYATGEVKLTLDEPYPFFSNEVLARVYERDEDKLIKLLNALPMYQSVKATPQNVHVLWPTRLPDKDIKGAISKETIFGVNRAGDKITSKVPVESLDLKKVEQIIDKKDGNKAVYAACCQWLKQGKPTRYPHLAKKGSPVKKVCLELSGSPSSEVDLSNGRYADNSSVVRVNVYQKKEGDPRYYFVPIYYYQISRVKIRARQLAEVKTGKRKISEVMSEPLFNLMWKRGDDGSMLIKEDDLSEHYRLVARLPRYSLIEITRNGKTGLCYSGGVTVGNFEIYSLLGDDVDLLKHGLIDSLSGAQNRLTVSTISSLKVRSISILGKIS